MLTCLHIIIVFCCDVYATGVTGQVKGCLFVSTDVKIANSDDRIC